MSATIRIWDLPLRLFHWLLVTLIGFSWWSGEEHLMDWHRRSGYAILGLLVFRLYWGLAGSRTARFAEFVRGPGAVLVYAGSLLRGSAERKPVRGHNPMGGWSVLLLLLTLIAMVTAGLFAVDVDGLESGPLADYVSFDSGRLASHIHGFVFNLLLVLVALHLGAVLFYLVRMKTNLVRPMITGRAPVDPGADPGEDGNTGIAPPPALRVVVGVALAVAVAWAVARGFHFGS